MGFPQIQYKATNVALDPAWQTLIEQKFQSLEKYVKAETDAKCDVEFEKETSGHHNMGKLHRVEVNLFVRGKLHRAEASEENFEKAIDAVRRELDRQLAEKNDKRETLLRRGGRKIKEMLRFGLK